MNLILTKRNKATSIYLGYEKTLRQIDGMLSDLSLKNQKAGIEFDEAKLKVDEIISLSLAPRRR